MTDLVALLGRTVFFRPCVFAFLAVHCWSAGRALGARRAAALTGIVWATAFGAELASTQVGFPFGLYTYTEATRGLELYIGNVPFISSLSFAFLAWASYALALALTRPRGGGAEGGGGVPLERRTAPRTLAVAVACFVLIDVIIDPLAVRGGRWFLGKIFEYPNGGIYFGVPLSNFGGWAVVGGVGLTLYAALDRRWEARGRPASARGGAGFPVGAALWFAIAAFNLLITIAIGEIALACVGFAIAGGLVTALSLSKGPARGAVRLPGLAARAGQRETICS